MKVLPEPCASCPYRTDHPSGTWAPEEYLKLLEFADPDIGESVAGLGVFLCHHSRLGFAEHAACRGWASVESQSLAVRMAFARHVLDPTEVLDHTPSISLFNTGQEAAENGLRDIDRPGKLARTMQADIRRKARRAGVDVD